MCGELSRNIIQKEIVRLLLCFDCQISLLEAGREDNYDSILKTKPGRSEKKYKKG